MERVIIIGAGGHAREVAEILRHQASAGTGPQPAGFVVEEPENHLREVGGLPVLGGWSWFKGEGREGLAVICAVGSPQLRRRMAERASSEGLKFTSAVSPLAYLSPEAQLGAGVMIFPHCFVSAGSSIGEHAILNAAASVSHDTSVGRYSTLGPGVRLAGRVSVGEGAYIGVGASVIDRVSIGALTGPDSSRLTHSYLSDSCGRIMDSCGWGRRRYKGSARGRHGR